MNDLVLCDIGDGQSIAENLSTFSAHMKNVISILERAGRESLVLLDELGSGTDPAAGMGLAVAVLDALCARGCLFVVTTHYPEIKTYAAGRPGLANARMAFDKNTLRPLYRLEQGEAGESCALYIAEKMGMPEALLARAYEAAYGGALSRPAGPPGAASAPSAPGPGIVRQRKPASAQPSRSMSFQIGDSVVVYPKKETGIVFARDNGRGEIGVQVKGKKLMVNHKRIKLQVSAKELYPENYDFSILFDSVENRKARHILERKHVEDTVITVREGDQAGTPRKEDGDP
jgi:dsDNA-specific endonuclease/ATPase MutS2